MPLQVKLLRVLQEREVERIGGTRSLKLDFRVIAATNRDLKAMLARGEFRQDLYYRLNIFLLKTPPLRQIKSDIPRLAYHLLSRVLNQVTLPRRIEPEAMRRLVAYDWPGNVRELRNVLERAASVAQEGVILEEHLPMEIRDDQGMTLINATLPTLKDEIAQAECRAIRRALSMTGGNRTEAARQLGIHRTGLYQKMRHYGLDGKPKR
jgi:transcriptional regulator with PAS, ATPase and Fis domain